MAVTAIQDGNKSIHPAAISSFSASESELTAETHACAEKLLNPEQKYDGHVCIVDGAPCLDAAAKKHYKGITVTACRRHLLETLLRTHHASVETYQKLIRVPRTRQAFAETLFRELPKDSPLHDMERHYFCDAYLPEGVDNHGIRINNPAEILNSMLSKARQEDSHFRAMMAVEILLASRQTALESKVRTEKLKLAPAGAPLTLTHTSFAQVSLHGT